MLTPGGYAEAVCPRGTTTVFADPHELANVAGVAGVRYAVEASRGLPVRFIVQAPSCVPPQPGLELSGADLFRPDIDQMLAWPEVGRPGRGDGHARRARRPTERMTDVVAAGFESGKLVSGHAAGLTGAALQAYLAAGMTSDHEIFTEPDCLEKLRAGMTVELRGALDAILPGIVDEVNRLPIPPTHLVAATDDLFALTLLEDGGLDHLLRRLDRATAWTRCWPSGARPTTPPTGCSASISALVAAGRQADVIVLDDLERVTVERGAGRRARWSPRAAGWLVDRRRGAERSAARHHAARRRSTARRLRAAARRARRRAPDAGDRRRGDDPLGRDRPSTCATAWSTLPPGHLVQVTVHRHGRIAPVPQAALLAGWGDWTGAVATTVAHDTHNLVVFGRDADDMALAANTVIASGGGVAVVRGGRGAGADRAADRRHPVAAARGRGRRRRSGRCRTRPIGVGLTSDSAVLTQPLFQVMLSSLACLPGPHVTDVGLIDGTTGELVAIGADLLTRRPSRSPRRPPRPA